MTNRQLLELELGLRQLDAIRGGEEKEKFVAIEFDAKTSYRLMRNRVFIEPAKMAFDKADRAAAKDAGYYEGMSVNDENAKKADAYQQRRADLLDEEIEVDGLMLVTVENLLNRPEEDPKTKKPKRNPVPQSVIARLAPILKVEEAP